MMSLTFANGGRKLPPMNPSPNPNRFRRTCGRRVHSVRISARLSGAVSRCWNERRARCGCTSDDATWTCSSFGTADILGTYYLRIPTVDDLSGRLGYGTVPYSYTDPSTRKMLVQFRQFLRSIRATGKSNLNAETFFATVRVKKIDIVSLSIWKFYLHLSSSRFLRRLLPEFLFT